MGFVFDQVAANTISKEIYTDKDIETLAFDSPLIGLMPKWTQGGGIQYVGAINNALLTSVSSQDTIAFTTGSPSVYQRWQCPWKQNFGSRPYIGHPASVHAQATTTPLITLPVIDLSHSQHFGVTSSTFSCSTST